PGISVNPTSLDFGTVTTGQSKDLTLAVSNTGTTALNVASVLVNGAAFTAPTASGFTVQAGSSQNLTVHFAPISTGPASGSITIASDDPIKPTVTVNLTGTGGSAGPSACGFTLGAEIFAKWT